MKILLVVTGTFLLGLGILGIFLPLLPATPFFLLAAACYARSSRTLYNYLLNNKWFGQYIKNLAEKKGVQLKTKLILVILLVLSIGYSVIFVVHNFIYDIFLVLVAIGVVIHIFSLPTMEANKK